MVINKNLFAVSLSSVCILSAFLSCTSSKNYTLPKQEQYQGYKILDGVDKDTLAVKLETNEKIAVVLRDITTTSYSFIEPRYNNSMVRYDGKSQCCGPNSPMMGNSGLIVYKFSFIGKGNTTINLVSRQKGLSVTAASFETDHLVTVNATVE